MLGAIEYRVADGYHYNAAGEQAQAEIVAGVIKQWLLNQIEIQAMRLLKSFMNSRGEIV
jgi:hypothetical protein